MDSPLAMHCREIGLQYECVPAFSCALVIPFDDEEAMNVGVAELRTFLKEKGDSHVAVRFDASTEFNSEGNVEISSTKKWECSGEGMTEIPNSFVIIDCDSESRIPRQCICETKKKKQCSRMTNHSTELCWQHRPK